MTQTTVHHTLSRLLADFAFVDACQDVVVNGLADDSRRVRPGDLFLAMAGQASHGAGHIDQAIAAGAVAVAVEPGPGVDLAALRARCEAQGVSLVVVEQLAQKAGFIAARFHGQPAAALRVIGITGTNGKTSCSQFLAQSLQRQGRRCGVIGTLGSGLWGALQETGFTTPMAVALQAKLAELRRDGAEFVAMEVSSHALEQGRVNGVDFEVALLTNLSQDHLDYHGDMACYAMAKKRLFHMPGLRRAVLNLDDALGRELADELRGTGVDVLGYGLDTRDPSALRVKHLEQDEAGLTLTVHSPWGEGELRCGLLGRFNAANLLGVLGVLLALGEDFAAALASLAGVQAPPGRMERLPAPAHKPRVVIDYAHTPDALRQALETLRQHCRGALWLVFGCGGNRDRGKRALMGRVAAELADHIVLTDDNPRDESPARILADIRAGIGEHASVCSEHDRARAIAHAIGRAEAGDWVLIAGKGHERHQLVGGRKLPFSDREMAERCLQEAA